MHTRTFCILLTVWIAACASSIAAAAEWGENANLAPVFADDPVLHGRWQVVDFVPAVDAFVPKKRAFAGALALGELVFAADGSVPGRPWIWTRGRIIHPGDRTAAAYEIKEIEGDTYLFFEWVGGDVTLRGKAPHWYVLKKAVPAVAPADGDEIAALLAPSLIRVKLWTKKHDGQNPSVRGMDDDMENERPTLIGGYLWDAEHVLINDPVLHEHFIDHIEAEFGKTTVAASVAGYFRRWQGMLLKLEAPLPGAQPLPWEASPPREELGALRMVRYKHANSGGWGMGISGTPFRTFVRTDKGDSVGDAGGPSLVLRPDGKPVGVSMNEWLSLEDGTYPWRQEHLHAEPVWSAAEKAAAREAFTARLRQAAPGIKFDLRSKVDEDEQENHWDRDDKAELSEVFATGFLIGPNRLLVPTSMERDVIARIETITATFSAVEDGADPVARECTFAGALREWQAVLLDVPGEPLPGAYDLSDLGEFRMGELFLKCRVDYSLRERKETHAYDRYRGQFLTYKSRPSIMTFTNEDAGSIAVTPEGKLLALAVAVRLPANEERHYYRQSNAAFRPADLLRDTLAEAEAVDPTLKPLDEAKEKQAIFFGVEFQGLNLRLAKTLNVETETRGGEIGVLVQHVYPGSLAAAGGVQEGDILLRLHAPDRSQPIDLKNGYRGWQRGFDMSDFSDGQHVQFRGGMPAPWPTRRHMLTRILTDIGGGQECRIEYLRGGTIQAVTFTTAANMNDYRSAAKHKNKELGLTVKELTHEVRRFYKRDDDAGVVVSHVEMGSKAMVAGIGLFQLITHVNGEAVADLADYKAKLKAVLDAGTAVELTISFMGKSRLAKIER